jgi:hypothetical protein
MADLALLLASDFHIGDTSILRLKSKRPFWVKYFTNGRLHERHFRSALSWRALMMAVIEERQQFLVLQMDERRRLRQMFPPEVMGKLAANAERCGDMLPVVRLYHPDSLATVIITRGRCRGHAVDALHNLSGVGPVFHPIWIADLMRLNSMIGLRLVRDSSFKPRCSIHDYLTAASSGGALSLVAPERCSVSAMTRLPVPLIGRQLEIIRDEYCLRQAIPDPIRARTIYDDYGL